jgi:hypothetical protein
MSWVKDQMWAAQEEVAMLLDREEKGMCLFLDF